MSFIPNEEKQQQLTGKNAEETVAKVNRDVNSSTGSNALETLFDEQTINTAFEITQAFAQEVNTFVSQKAAQLENDKEALEAEKQKPIDQQDAQRNPLLWVS